MKRILIELDDACAQDLERVAPVKQRKRAEFVRLAIRRAIDLSWDRLTEQAYQAQPLNGDVTPGDLVGWDEQNALAKPAVASKKPSRRNRAA
jgi:Arc/MetJ family transcription regulator